MIDAAHDDGAPRTPPRGGADSEEIRGDQDDDETYYESDGESCEDKEHGPAKKQSP